MDYRIYHLIFGEAGMTGSDFHHKTTRRPPIAPSLKCGLDAAGSGIQTVFIAAAYAHCSDRQEHHVRL
jgi:hypothetical protein